MVIKTKSHAAGAFWSTQTGIILRWITFVPAFIAYIVIGQSLVLMVDGWLYDSTFPVDGLLDLGWAVFSFSLMILIPIIFLAFLVPVLKISPNVKIGSCILSCVFIIVYSFAYISGGKDFDKGTTWLNTLLDVIVVIILVAATFKGLKESED